MNQLADDTTRRPLTIAFEGIDGAGKTFQLQCLKRKIMSLLAADRNAIVVASRDRPLRATYKRLIRDTHCFPGAHISLLCGTAVFLDIQEATFSNVDATARVALFDRHIASPLSDAIAFGINSRLVAAMWAHLPRPDTTVFLDVSPRTAIKRKATVSLAEAGGPFWLDKAGTLEEAFVQYQSAANQGYRVIEAISRSSDNAWMTVDGECDREETASTIWNSLAPILTQAIRT